MDQFDPSVTPEDSRVKVAAAVGSCRDLPLIETLEPERVAPLCKLPTAVGKA